MKINIPNKVVFTTGLSNPYYTLFTISRNRNAYTANLNKIPSNEVCLFNNDGNYWIWHMRIANIHMDHLKELVHKELVIGLPNTRFEKSMLYDVCQKKETSKSLF